MGDISFKIPDAIIATFVAAYLSFAGYLLVQIGKLEDRVTVLEYQVNQQILTEQDFEGRLRKLEYLKK